MRRASLCALVIAATACAHLRGENQDRLDILESGGGVFRVSYRPEDAPEARRVEAALARAAVAAERWGRFSAPVLVTIHPTHRALEAATRRKGYGWMRAFARFDSVELQAPRTWSAGDAEVEQVLAHELTHCVMYQAIASRRTWRGRAIPLWFREGMASVTAGQEHRRVAPEAISRFYRERARQGATGVGAPAADPLSEPDALYRSDSDLVYATAHRAFRFLLERGGEERIRTLLAGMREGAGFPEAFREAMGLSVEEFERDFKHDVVSHGAPAR